MDRERERERERRGMNSSTNARYGDDFQSIFYGSKRRVSTSKDGGIAMADGETIDQGTRETEIKNKNRAGNDARIV